MQIAFSPDDLRPLVQTVVTELLDRFGNDDRLAYSEEEAARLIGVPRHCLRDDRLKGRVECGHVGRKVRYTRRQLLEYLERRHPE